METCVKHWLYEPQGVNGDKQKPRLDWHNLNLDVLVGVYYKHDILGEELSCPDLNLQKCQGCNENHLFHPSLW